MDTIMKKRICMLLAMLLALALLAGCGSKEEPAATALPEESAAPAEAATPIPEAYAVIGQEVESEYSFAVRLTNRTGADIAGVSVKSEFDAEYPENMLPEGETFAAGETRILWYDATEAFTAANASAAADAPERTPEFTVQLTFADGTALELHAFPFGDAAEGDVFRSGDLAFLSYTSVSTQETVSTQGAEQAILDAQAAAAAAAQQPAPQTTWQADPQPQTPEEPDDACVEDGIMY